MSTIAHSILAIDISKDRLDISTLPARRRWSCGNDTEGLARVVGQARRQQATVIFEATSVYDRGLIKALDAAGLPYHRANPRKARQFARAAGFLAKTDRVDSDMLAAYAASVPLSLAEPVAAERQAVRRLLDRREQLVAMRKAEMVRRQQIDDPEIAGEVDDHIIELTRRIDDYEARIEEAMRHSTLAPIKTWLVSAPGVAGLTSAGLVAGLPELGRRSAKTISALVGIAPIARDSGKLRGRRTIWGGRAHIRRLLFLAARHAMKNPAFKPFADRLLEAGKPRKLVIIAVARKLLVVLNTMVKEQRPFRPADA
jgi:transposase